jgi:hypothetical protein
VSDDVLIGDVRVRPRPVRDVLTEGTVDLSVHDATSGAALPARITVADPQGSLIALGNLPDPRQAVRPGVVYTADGSASLQLPAGRYVLHAGRGFEYSVASLPIEVRAGSRATHRLTIRRDVDTAGWAAMDPHVHTATFARHGDATIAERMVTIAGEGVEIPVSTEHNQRVDFDAAAREAGLRGVFTPLLGSEVTTPSLGHFNVFALPREGGAIDPRAPDWSRLRDGFRTAAADPVVVLNHGRDVHGGFRPLDPARHVSIAGEALDGAHLPATAMEVVNSGAVMNDPLALPRDWLGLLNRGVRLTPVGSSDSHDVSRFIVGQGRTYVRCDDRDPGRIDPAQAIEAVRKGQVTVSYGLLAEIDVNGHGPGALVPASGGLAVRVRVKGPAWTRAERVLLFVNGLQVREERIRDGSRPGLKSEQVWRIPAPSHDVHLVAVAVGPGVSAPYWPTAKPYQPTSAQFTPYVLGLTGAVFVDADGSGRFESAYEYAQRVLEPGIDAASLGVRLAAFDAAVATQAASLVRVRDPDGFERRLEMLASAAAAHVAGGVHTYLQAWRQHAASAARR